MVFPVWWEGQILFRDNKPAMSLDCCCGCPPPCCSDCHFPISQALQDQCAGRRSDLDTDFDFDTADFGHATRITGLVFRSTSTPVGGGETVIVTSTQSGPSRHAVACNNGCMESRCFFIVPVGQTDSRFPGTFPSELVVTYYNPGKWTMGSVAQPVGPELSGTCSLVDEKRIYQDDRTGALLDYVDEYNWTIERDGDEDPDFDSVCA